MSFTAKTSRVEQLALIKQSVIQDLDSKLSEFTIIFVDWANVIGWQDKLGWYIDTKRLKQFFSSFSQVKKIYFYYGTLEGNETSLRLQGEFLNIFGSGFVNKPVKIMHRSIDTTSISEEDPYILRDFLSPGLMKQLYPKEIKIFNQGFKAINDRGIVNVEERKCNFDVEIGVDMLLERKALKETGNKTTFVLWSGDSDFMDITQRLIQEGCEMIIAGTVRRISKELSESGAFIYEIQKIKEFICRPKQIGIHLAQPLLQGEILDTQKGDS